MTVKQLSAKLAAKKFNKIRCCHETKLLSERPNICLSWKDPLWHFSYIPPSGLCLNVIVNELSWFHGFGNKSGTRNRQNLLRPDLT